MLTQQVITFYETMKWHLNPFKAFSIVYTFYTSNTNKRPKLRRDIQILFVQYGYAWGVLPFYYDEKRDKYIVHESRSSLFCWFTFMTVYMIITSVLVLAQIKYHFIDKLKISNFNDIVSIFYAMNFFSTGLIHLHTGYKTP